MVCQRILFQCRPDPQKNTDRHRENNRDNIQFNGITDPRHDNHGSGNIGLEGFRIPPVPFGDNIERAHKSGVQYVAQPGGSVRDDNVIETCNKYNMVMSFTGLRLFHH